MSHWLLCMLPLLATKAMRTEIVGSDLIEFGSNKSVATDCEVPGATYKNVPADICKLMQKQNCCCERVHYDQNGNAEKQQRGNPADLFGLCPAEACFRHGSIPWEDCESSAKAWTCHRTKRFFGQGLGCAAKPNGKASDSVELYNRMEFYMNRDGQVLMGKDPEEVKAEAEAQALADERAKKYRAKFAAGNVVERYPAPMYGIKPAPEEGVVTKGCASDGQTCIIWYYTKADQDSSNVPISHEDMYRALQVGSSEWRESDGLVILGQWTELDYEDSSLKNDIKKAVQGYSLDV